MTTRPSVAKRWRSSKASKATCGCASMGSPRCGQSPTRTSSGRTRKRPRRCISCASSSRATWSRRSMADARSQRALTIRATRRRSRRCRRRCAPRWLPTSPEAATAPSVAEVLVLQREVGDRLLHQRDRLLQIVPLGARHPHRVALDRSLHLELAVLQQLDDALGEILFHPGADGDHLLDLVAGDLLHVAVLQRTDVDLAFRELAGQDVGHLLELEIVVGIERQGLVVGFDAGVGALEVEARRDFLVHLVDGVAYLDLVDLGNDVERWHGGVLPVVALERRDAAAPRGCCTTSADFGMFDADGLPQGCASRWTRCRRPPSDTGLRRRLMVGDGAA